RVHGDRRAQQLDRNVAVELAVASPPDDAHAAFADLVEQLVAGGQHRHRQSSAPLELSATSGTALTPLSVAPLYRRYASWAAASGGGECGARTDRFRCDPLS